MFRNQFLDSWDEKTFSLLLFLNEHGTVSTKEACSKALGISPKTLTKAYDSLTEVATDTGFFELSSTHNQLQLNIYNDYNLTNIFYYLLQRSIKHTIVADLFRTNAINNVDLEETLGLSHATLYRKIDELNDLFSDFKLKASNKGLIGPELQIRHFYIDYLVTAFPYNAIFNNFYNENLDIASKKFEELFNTQLDIDSHVKLISYLSIIKKRYDIGAVPNDLEKQYPFFENTLNYNAQIKFLEDFRNSSLAIDFDEYMNFVGDLFEINLSKSESELFLLFVMGHNIFRTASKQFNQIKTLQTKSGSPLENIINEIQDKLHAFNIIDENNFILKNEITNYLTIICWNQAIFYGGVYMYSDLSFNQLLNFKKFKDIRKYITHFFIDEYPEFKSQELQNQRFIVNLLLIFLYSANNSSLSYQIGVVIKGDIMYRQLIQKQVINRINSLEYTYAEAFDSRKKYDLVISNVDLPLLRGNGADFYLLNNQFTHNDFNLLEQKIIKNAEIKKDL